MLLSFSKKYEEYGWVRGLAWSNTTRRAEEKKWDFLCLFFAGQLAIDNITVNFPRRLFVASSRLICHVICSNLFCTTLLQEMEDTADQGSNAVDITM